MYARIASDRRKHNSNKISPESDTVGHWGQDLEITCQGDRTYVRSAGIDRRFGTTDDILVGP